MAEPQDSHTATFCLPEGETARVLNPSTITSSPVPNTSSVYSISGTSRSLGFSKFKCSSQLFSCSPPAPFRECPLQKLGEKGVWELPADLSSCPGLPTPSLGSDSPHGCSLSILHSYHVAPCRLKVLPPRGYWWDTTKTWALAPLPTVSFINSWINQYTVPIYSEPSFPH